MGRRLRRQWVTCGFREAESMPEHEYREEQTQGVAKKKPHLTYGLYPTRRVGLRASRVDFSIAGLLHEVNTFSGDRMENAKKEVFELSKLSAVVGHA